MKKVIFVLSFLFTLLLMPIFSQVPSERLAIYLEQVVLLNGDESFWPFYTQENDLYFVLRSEHRQNGLRQKANDCATVTSVLTMPAGTRRDFMGKEKEIAIVEINNTSEISFMIEAFDADFEPDITQVSLLKDINNELLQAMGVCSIVLWKLLSNDDYFGAIAEQNLDATKIHMMVKESKKEYIISTGKFRAQLLISFYLYE